MATTKDYRNYKASYTAALISKMVNSDFITFFSRKSLITSSLKISARYLKGSVLLNNTLQDTDVIKLYVSNVNDSLLNNKIYFSEVMFLVLPLNKNNIILTYSDYLKLKINKFTVVLIDTLNTYLQCFEKFPINGDIQSIS